MVRDEHQAHRAEGDVPVMRAPHRTRLSVLVSAELWLVACAAQASSSAVGHPPKRKVVITADDVHGIALDGHGHIYLVEEAKTQIAEYSLSGSRIGEWPMAASVEETGLPAKVTLDSIGNVYVTEPRPNRLKRFSATGVLLAQWGGGIASSEPGTFNFPIGVRVEDQGNIHVADAYNSRTQKLSTSGLPLSQWGSDGADPGHFHIPFHRVTMALAAGHVISSLSWGAEVRLATAG